jgi:hypothetical protein
MQGAILGGITGYEFSPNLHMSSSHFQSYNNNNNNNNNNRKASASVFSIAYSCTILCVGNQYNVSLYISNLTVRKLGLELGWKLDLQ